MRSKRLFHLLQQNFSGYSKIENLIKRQIFALGITESNGFELLRLIRKEFSLLSRSEALGYREQCVKFRVKKTDHLPDIVREVQTEIDSFHSMLEASIIAGQLTDVRISEGDQFLLYMRSLPSKVQEFLQLHQNATTVQQLFVGVQDYYIRTRVQGDMGSFHVTQPLQKPDVKDKTCFNCGKKGHLAENCPEPKKCSHCGKLPPFLGLSLHTRRLDDMDKVAWQMIEEQEVARVQTWHTKQGVYRKKLRPDVRDDPMGDPTGEL